MNKYVSINGLRNSHINMLKFDAGSQLDVSELKKADHVLFKTMSIMKSCKKRAFCEG